MPACCRQRPFSELLPQAGGAERLRAGELHAGRCQSPDSIMHQVLCMGHARMASIPQGDRSAANRVIDRLVNEIYWIVQAAWLGIGRRERAD